MNPLPQTRDHPRITRTPNPDGMGEKSESSAEAWSYGSVLVAPPAM